MTESELEALIDEHRQNFAGSDWRGRIDDIEASFVQGLQKGFEIAKERAAAIADEFYSADDCASDIRAMQIVDDPGGEGFAKFCIKPECKCAACEALKNEE